MYIVSINLIISMQQFSAVINELLHERRKTGATYLEFRYDM